MKLGIKNQKLGIKGFVLCLTISYILYPTSSLAGSLNKSLDTSASGMKAESERIKILTENIANSDTTGLNPDEDPYQRKTIFFQQVYDKNSGANVVKLRKIGVDNSEFKLVYQPSHPAADAEGYVKYPNVDKSLESMDLREAQRNYEANISAIEITRGMMDRSLDLMR
jgi:flagellar basal-body rod protein FlgC